MKKILLIIVLLITTFVNPLTSNVQAAEPARFSDISTTHWAQREIGRLLEHQLIGGYGDGTFRPDKMLTRAEAIKIIVQALNIEVGQNSSTKLSHSDVPNTYWAFPYIEAAQKHTLITGYADGSFRPEATITRADSAVLIARSFELASPPLSSVLPNDIKSSHWAAASISKLIVNGIAIGDQDGKFLPSKMVSRSEFAALLARTLYSEFRLNSLSENNESTKFTLTEADGDHPVATSLLNPSPSPSPTPQPNLGGGLGIPSGGDSSSSILPVPAPLPTSSLPPLVTPVPTPTAVPVLLEVSELQSITDETSLSLNWINPSVASFKEVYIYKEGIKVASTSGTFHKEADLAPSTTYTFMIKTVDSLNRESNGKVLKVTTADSKSPNSPVGLIATPHDGYIQLYWAENSDNNLSGYNVFLDGHQYNTSTVTQATYTYEGLTNGKSYNLFVTALDTSNKESLPSASLNVIPMPSDLLSPDEISSFSSSNDGKAITMTWNNPADPDFERVDIYYMDTLIGSTKEAAYIVDGLQSEMEYEYVLKTVDNNGNASNGTNVSVRTKDITPPAAPMNVIAEAGPSKISLSWSLNSEYDLAGYNIYVNDIKINNDLITQTSYTLNKLDFGIIYELQLEAVDSSRNASSKSEKVSSTPTHYLIELSRWGIYNDGSHPEETVKGINNALTWAHDNGVTATMLPRGTYLIAKSKRITMVANMLFELPDDAILQKETNEKERYDLMYVGYGADNVTLKGGTYYGDKLTHDYSQRDPHSPGTHEGGFGIFIEGAANTTVDGVKAVNFTGDGLVLGGYGTMVKDLYAESFVSGALGNSGQVIDDVNRIRTKTAVPLTNPIFTANHYFEISNLVNLPNSFEVYFYKADGTFIHHLTAKSRDILEIPDGANYFHLVLNKSNSINSYLEVWNRVVSKNAVVKNSEFAYNRRQGITIGGADNALIINNVLHDMKGTAPESGIDVEGGYGENGNLNTNIFIKNNQFYNNAKYDVILYDGHNATVEGNHLASKGSIGLAISVPFKNALVKDNHFDGTRISAHHDATFLNNRLNDSYTFFEGPNIIIDGLDITNGTLSVSSKIPFGVKVSNVSINITRNVEAGLRVWDQPIHLENITITGAGSLGSFSGGVAEGSVFDGLKVIDYNPGNGISLPPGTYNNSVFQAAEGSRMGTASLSGRKYTFNNCTFTSNATGNIALYGEHVDLDLTITDSTFNVMGDSNAISIQAAKKVILENNTINAMNMVRSNLELIKINDYWKRNDPVDIMSATIMGNTINSNIATIGISTIYAGIGAPAYTVKNNTLNKAVLALKSNDLQGDNILR